MNKDEKIMLSGYLSVIGAITNEFRTIDYVLIESERYEKIKKSKLRKPEQNQYRRIFDECKKKNIEVRFTLTSDFDGLKTSGGIAASVSERTFLSTDAVLKSDNPFIIFIEGVEDPYNFGYILRSFYLAGVTAVVIPKFKYNFFNEIVAKSSAGLSETMDIAICDDLTAFCAELKQNGVKIVCTAIENSVSMYDASLKKPIMLVIGGEKRGISRSVLELADEVVRIDYAVKKNISLPAVSASAVLAFEVYRKNQ